MSCFASCFGTRAAGTPDPVGNSRETPKKSLLAAVNERCRKSPVPMNSEVTKMIRGINEQAAEISAEAAYAKKHNGRLPPKAAVAVAEQVMEAVGSLVATARNLEVQIAETSKKWQNHRNTGELDRQLAPLKADLEKVKQQAALASSHFSNDWALVLPPKPTEVDDPAALRRLPLANAPGKLTQLGVLGWIHLSGPVLTPAAEDSESDTDEPADDFAAAPTSGSENAMETVFASFLTAAFDAFEGFVDASNETERAKATSPLDVVVASFSEARIEMTPPLTTMLVADIDEYQQVFDRKVAESGGPNILDELDATVTAAQRRIPSETEIKGLTRDKAAPNPVKLGYAAHIRKMAAPTALTLYMLASILIASTAQAAGAYCIPGPIKGLRRMVAKVIEKYDSFGPCHDIARCTVHFPSFPALIAFLEALIGCGQVIILRIKNRFKAAYDAVPNGGYRDLQLLLLLPDGGGSVADGCAKGKVFRYCELQLNLKDMVAIKNGESSRQKKAGGGGGHDAFNLARAIDAFSPRTLRYKGAADDKTWALMKAGALLEVDFERMDLSERLEQEKLKDALASPQCRVRKLLLGLSKLGAEGGKQLAKGLIANKSMVEVDLGNNRIGGESGKLFATLLKVNNTITNLDLRNCHLGSSCGTEIAAALETNTTITVLDVSHNSFDDSTKSAIEAAWGRGDRNEDYLEL